MITKLSLEVSRQALDQLQNIQGASDTVCDQIWRRIEDQNSKRFELAQQVLYQATFATKPLTISELQSALAVESKEPEFDMETIPQSEHIVSACAGLVEIDPESQIVQLVHHSARDYLKRVVDRYRIVQARVVRSRLAYLLYDFLGGKFCFSYE